MSSHQPIGIRRSRSGWRAYISINHAQCSKRFPLETPLSRMQAWREEQKLRVELQARNDVQEAKRVPPCLTGWCYVYFVRSGQNVKIGRSIDPDVRLRELQTTHAGELVLLASVPAHAALERALHARFQHLRTRSAGEWFRLEPDLIAFIRAIQEGANPVALLFEDPRVILGWHLHPPPPNDAQATPLRQDLGMVGGAH